MGRMSEQEYDGFYYDGFAADAKMQLRLAFIKRTYLHVFGAILAFIGLEAILLAVIPRSDRVMQMMFQSWWMILVGFMVVSWIAEKWAHSDVSQGMQYMGLGLYVVAEALIFLPMLMIASDPRFPYADANVIPVAAFLTLLIFGGLTAVVMFTKSDFSFMRGALSALTLGAIGLIFVSLFVPSIGLGIWFSVAMIVLMSGWILYDTSNILHHYRTDQHVGAALALFASVATLFWYVLRFVMAMASED